MPPATSIRRLAAGMTLASLVAMPSHAAFLDRGGFSTDTLTGLDWLDLTITAGPTTASVPPNEGWRLAKGNEVSGLFAEYIGSPNGERVYDDDLYDLAASFVRQLGVSTSFNNGEGAQAVFGINFPNQISVNGIYDDGNTSAPKGVGELTRLSQLEAGFADFRRGRARR